MVEPPDAQRPGAEGLGPPMDALFWLPSHRRRSIEERAVALARDQAIHLSRHHASVTQALIREYDEAMIECGCSRFTRDAVHKRAIESLVRKIEGPKPTEEQEPKLRAVGGADET